MRLKEDVANSRQDIAKSNGGKLAITKDDYSNLYEILTNECNPANFLSPYNAEKVRVANEIYSQLSTNCESIPKLIALRDEAINKLGITISAKRIFDKLSSAYDPSQFIGNNYDAQKLSIANDVYERVVNNEDNIIELEKIAKECGIFSIEDSSTIQ